MTAPQQPERPGKIDAIVICCFSGDLNFLRICIASIRHWYPTVPLLLLKDCSKGEFSTREMEQSHDVGVLDTEYRNGGWGLTKIEAFFGTGPKRILLLDSDTVILGDVLELLERYDDEFIVTGIYDKNENGRFVKRDYINVAAVKSGFDSDYAYPGYCFNTGHMVITRGLLRRSDFKSLVEFEDHGFATVAPHGLFPHADQGILNYVLARKFAQGECTVRYLNFWCWSGLDQARTYSLERVKAHRGYQTILHWAGAKRPVMQRMDRYDIMRFFQGQYYKRLRLGRVRLCVHEFVRLSIGAVRRTKKILKGLWTRSRCQYD